MDRDDGGVIEPPANVMYWVSAMMAEAMKALQVSLAPLGVTPLEYGVLHCCLLGGDATVSELAQVLPSDPSAISRAVTKMSVEGLFWRVRSPSDRRVVRLRLTAKGQTLALELRAHVEAENARMLTDVSERELQTFVEVAGKISAGLARIVDSTATDQPGGASQSPTDDVMPPTMDPRAVVLGTA